MPNYKQINFIYYGKKMSISVTMGDETKFALSIFTKHVRNMRLALIQIFRYCLDKLYEDCPRVSYEEAKHLAHISTLINRINPEVQDRKEEEKEKKKALEEEEEREKCEEIKRKRKKVLGS